ncbi:unnamed protein product [Vitrella brassicaformis CCMP3155]|uniref:Uncharacterized protein n=2 Tax=Vitrella brassicaformis TaxID=1169539 RepID=A0A0G4GSZ6_VITBC|nr:unnamed protein product [Vitrella brassicaformis CCMP3155]|eukprot:CEM33814.1 unnamed protein product [Vitrella brassicaformis CCMP3155]
MADSQLPTDPRHPSKESAPMAPPPPPLPTHATADPEDAPREKEDRPAADHMPNPKPSAAAAKVPFVAMGNLKAARSAFCPSATGMPLVGCRDIVFPQMTVKQLHKLLASGRLNRLLSNIPPSPPSKRKTTTTKTTVTPSGPAFSICPSPSPPSPLKYASSDDMAHSAECMNFSQDDPSAGDVPRGAAVGGGDAPAGVGCEDGVELLLECRSFREGEVRRVVAVPARLSLYQLHVCFLTALDMQGNDAHRHCFFFSDAIYSSANAGSMCTDDHRLHDVLSTHAVGRRGTFGYSFGVLQLTVTLTDIVTFTDSDLQWVPRVSSARGTAPSVDACGSPYGLAAHRVQTDVDVHEINGEFRDRTLRRLLQLPDSIPPPVDLLLSHRLDQLFAKPIAPFLADTHSRHAFVSSIKMQPQHTLTWPDEAPAAAAHDRLKRRKMRMVAKGEGEGEGVCGGGGGGENKANDKGDVGVRGGRRGGGGAGRFANRKMGERKPGVLMYKFEAVVGGQRVVRRIACLGSLTWYNLYRALAMSLDHEVEHWVNEGQSTVPHHWELPDGSILPHTDFDYKNQSGSRCPRPDFDKDRSFIGTTFKLVYGAVTFHVVVEDVIVYEQRMEDRGAGLLNLHKWVGRSFPRLVAEGSVGVAPSRRIVTDEGRLAMYPDNNAPIDILRINRELQGSWWNSNLAANSKKNRARDLPTVPTKHLSRKAQERLVRALYVLPPRDFISQLTQLASSRTLPDGLSLSTHTYDDHNAEDADKQPHHHREQHRHQHQHQQRPHLPVPHAAIGGGKGNGKAAPLAAHLRGLVKQHAQNGTLEPLHLDGGAGRVGRVSRALHRGCFLTGPVSCDLRAGPIRMPAVFGLSIKDGQGQGQKEGAGRDNRAHRHAKMNAKRRLEAAAQAEQAQHKKARMGRSGTPRPRPQSQSRSRRHTSSPSLTPSSSSPSRPASKPKATSSSSSGYMGTTQRRRAVGSGKRGPRLASGGGQGVKRGPLVGVGVGVGGEDECEDDERMEEEEEEEDADESMFEGLLDSKWNGRRYLYLVKKRFKEPVWEPAERLPWMHESELDRFRVLFASARQRRFPISNPIRTVPDAAIHSDTLIPHMAGGADAHLMRRRGGAEREKKKQREGSKAAGGGGGGGGGSVSEDPDVINSLDVLEVRAVSEQFAEGSCLVRYLGLWMNITLWNLCRVFLATFDYPDDSAEIHHEFRFPDGRTIGPTDANYYLCSGSAPRLVTMLPESVLRGEAPFTFVYGELAMDIHVLGVYKSPNYTHNIRWLPRAMEGSYGKAPPRGSCRDLSQLQSYSVPEELDIMDINEYLMKARFEKNWNVNATRGWRNPPRKDVELCLCEYRRRFAGSEHLAMELKTNPKPSKAYTDTMSSHQT